MGDYKPHGRKYVVVNDVEQGSQDWLDMRLGKATASRFKDVMSNGRKKGTVGKAYDSYLLELAAESLTNEQNGDLSHVKAIKWGHEQEPDARAAYAFENPVDVVQVAFVVRLDIPHVGGSPDGIVVDERSKSSSRGGVEIKCPYDSKVHLRYMLDDKVPDEYFWQVHGLMWLMEADWWDFVSYDPRMPAGKKLFVKRAERDEKVFIDLEERLAGFSLDLTDMRKKLGVN